MNLRAICYYRGESDTWTSKWRDEDYKARNLVKAVKHLPFNGFSEFKTTTGKIYRVDDTSRGRSVALSFASFMIAKRIRAAGYEQTYVIPVPSSSHVDPACGFTGRRLAEAVQQKDGSFIALPALHFDSPLPKSAGGGGSRNPYLIGQHLRIIPGSMPAAAVLIDDVCSTGGHLIACARYLAQRGVTVADAFVVGRTAWDQPENMFTVAVEQLETTDIFDSFA